LSARAWTYFGIVSFLWGIPYLFIKVAIDDGVPPGFLAWARVVLGAVVLLLICWRTGLLSSLRGRWRALAPYAVVEIAIPFPLIGAGEQYVSSSIAAILIAAVPLIVALLALRFDATERVTGSRLCGLLVGLAGVVALVGVDIAGSADELLGAALIGIAAVGYAAGPMYLRNRLSDMDPRALMAGSLIIASVVLTPFAAADLPEAGVSADAILSIVVLGVFCTAAAFVFFGALVIDVGAGRALVITYVAPIVAVIAGVAVLDERPGPGSLAGLALILVGSWIATRGRPSEPGSPPEPRSAPAAASSPPARSS